MESVTQERICIRCNQSLPLARYGKYASRRGGIDFYCIDCRRELRNASYQRHPMLPGSQRAANWHRKYEITPEQYQEMLQAQNGLCACCGQPETKIDHRTQQPHTLAVDHCHTTGHVRALLCSACNTSLGLLNEDPERIRQLLDYALRKCH